MSIINAHSLSQVIDARENERRFSRVNYSIFGARHPFRGAAFGLSHGLFLDVLAKLKLVADTNGELGAIYGIH